MLRKDVSGEYRSGILGLGPIRFNNKTGGGAHSGLPGIVVEPIRLNNKKTDGISVTVAGWPAARFA